MWIFLDKIDAWNENNPGDLLMIGMLLCLILIFLGVAWISIPDKEGK